MKIPLKALAVVSPALHDAIVLHNRTTNARITSVHLPYGDLYAYKCVLGWILDIIAAGKLIRIQGISQARLLRYDRIHHIAVKLGIGFLKMGMVNRINGILYRAYQSGFILDLDEVYEIYMKLTSNHPLRHLVSQVLTIANHYHHMDPNFCAALAQMAANVPALSYDLITYYNAACENAQGTADHDVEDRPVASSPTSCHAADDYDFTTHTFIARDHAVGESIDAEAEPSTRSHEIRAFNPLVVGHDV